MKENDAMFLALRYLFLLALALINLSWTYYIFTPLTTYPVFYILSLLYSKASLLSLSIFSIGQDYIVLVDACVAGAAYYLLIALNLTTPMNFVARVKSLSFIVLSFLILNIIRIIIFSLLFINDFSFFDITHKIVWYFGSTILVIIIWFANTHIFKIKGIPFYSDFKRLAKIAKS